MKKETLDLLLAGTIGVMGGILVTALMIETPTVDNNEELTHLRNYTRLDRALDKHEQEDEDWSVLNHDLIRINEDEWLWTYVVYDSYLEETTVVRMAFDNDINKCLWADSVDNDGYKTYDPKEDVDMEELHSYME